MVKVLSYPGPVNYPVKSFDFSGGEVQVRLESIPGDVREVSIQSDIRTPRDLIETALTVNAVSNISGSDYKIRLLLRYLPYSRQDRACSTGEAFSLDVILPLLTQNLGTGDTLVTWDVHSEVAQKILLDRDIPVNFCNVSAADLLEDLLNYNGIFIDPDTVVISPDKGAVERATKVKDKLGLSSVVYASKVRDSGTGEILRTEIPDYISYEGKPLLIVDDICDGGRTFIELAKVLREKKPSRIDLYVTHGIFSKGFEVFDDLIDFFYVANLSPTQKPENLLAINEQ
jgi:ribose-phosphate pyrophosphokinase